MKTKCSPLVCMHSFANIERQLKIVCCAYTTSYIIVCIKKQIKQRHDRVIYSKKKCFKQLIILYRLTSLQVCTIGPGETGNHFSTDGIPLKDKGGTILIYQVVHVSSHQYHQYQCFLKVLSTNKLLSAIIYQHLTMIGAFTLIQL